MASSLSAAAAPNSFSYTTSSGMVQPSINNQVYQSAPAQQQAPVYLNASTLTDAISAAASNLIKTTTSPPTYTTSNTYQTSAATGAATVLPATIEGNIGVSTYPGTIGGRPGGFHSQQFMMDEAALYRPQNAELVLPGRQLRGGMRPVYDPTLVRTFEAFPVFHAAVATTGGAVATTGGDAGIYQSINAGGVKVTHRGIADSQPSQAGSTAPPKSVGGSVSVQQELKKRNYVCC